MKPSEIQLHRISSTLLAQFPGLDLKQLLRGISIRLSGRTRRIREIRHGDDNKLLFSLRTSDGRYVPTFAGGLEILKTGYVKSRIGMTSEAAPFVAAGKTAFCKHVFWADDNIVPGCEVLVLDLGENLLGVGTAVQPGYAMLELDYGSAVQIKHYRDRTTSDS